MLNTSNIKVAMARKGVTGKQLAEMAGVNVNTVYSILRGGDTRASVLIKIANALGCHVSVFFLDESTSQLGPGNSAA